MGFLHSLKVWLRTEAAELSDSTKKMEARLDADLSRRERQLDETPDEALERLQGEITDSESSFDAIGDKIGHVAAKAEAEAELADGVEPDETETAGPEAEDSEVDD